MNEKIDAASRGVVAIPAAAAQLTFPAWWPGIDAASTMSSQLIPIFGAVAGLLYVGVQAVTLYRNIKAARSDDGDA